MLHILLNNACLHVVRLILLKVVSSPDEDKGHLEIERKFSLLKVSSASVIDRLKDEHFYFSGSLKSTDWFIPSPVKGELLRLRREYKDGVENYILTVKHWIATADDGRERDERERILRPITFFFLLYLGKFVTSFRLPTFRKSRDLYTGELEGKMAVAALDEATGLGEFSGPYLEIEVLAPRRSPSKAVQSAIVRLASRIAPEAAEVQQSYQEMLARSLAH
jgi:adenylate cyclase class IV